MWWKIILKIRNVLEKNRHKTKTCINVKSDDNNYKINSIHKVQNTMNLQSKSCRCKRWELTRISYAHVRDVVHMNINDCENHLDQCYFVKT